MPPRTLTEILRPIVAETEPVTPPGAVDLLGLFPAGLPKGAVQRAVATMVMRACLPVSWAQVLDWAALLEHPVAATSVVAARHSRTPRNLYGRLHTVRSAAAAAVLPLPVWSEASRPSRTEEDHQARVRWAWLLHCAPPELPTRGVGPQAWVTLAERRMARHAAQTLAAVGQLSPEALTTSVARVHTTSHRQIDTQGLLEVLERTGLAQLQDNGLLISAADIAPRQTHVRLLAAARSSGRTRHTTAEIQQLMRSAGYPRPAGPTLYNHPLLQRLGRDQWEILGATT